MRMGDPSLAEENAHGAQINHLTQFLPHQLHGKECCP
jgi:hypothetical protein